MLKITRLARLEVRRRRFVRMMSRNAAGAANLAWGLVIIGGVVECFWVGGLKHAQSAGEWALTAAGIAFSFAAMMFACKVLEVSVAYAVFVGIGTAGVVLSEIFVFGEPFSVAKVALIALLLAAVIALKFTSAEGGAHETAALEGVSEHLGLDEKIRAGLGLAADASSVRGVRSHLGGRGGVGGGGVGGGGSSQNENQPNSNLTGTGGLNSNFSGKNVAFNGKNAAEMDGENGGNAGENGNNAGENCGDFCENGGANSNLVATQTTAAHSATPTTAAHSATHSAPTGTHSAPETEGGR